MDKSKLYLILAFLAILALGTFLRIQTLNMGTLAEPDNYFHLATIQYMIQQHSILPSSLPFSGYPTHPVVYEPLGFYLLPIAFNAILGISVYNLLLYLPVLLGILTMIATYFLGKELSQSKLLPLLIMLFIAISLANMVRTSAGDYRGDSTVPLILITALIIFSKGAKSQNRKYLLLSGFLFGISFLFWRGATFIPLIMIFASIGLFFSKDKIPTILIPFGAMMITIAILSSFHLTGIITQDLSQAYQIAPNSVLASVNELQPPSFGFILQQFNIMLLFAPIGLWFLIKDYQTTKNSLTPYLVSYLIITLLLTMQAVRFVSLLSIPLAILSGIGAYKLMNRNKDYFWKFLIIGFFIMGIIFSYQHQSNLKAVDNLNPQFLQALGWIQNNTANNATFLTLWSDGSMIEGIANRTSITDSVGSQTIPQALQFSRWLYSNTINYTWINDQQGKYMLVRGFWMRELQGLNLENGANYSFSNNTNLWRLENNQYPNLSLVYSNNDSKVYLIKHNN